MQNSELNQEVVSEIHARLKYQRAIYRFHECDDPELRKHFATIIKDYETKHPKQSDWTKMFTKSQGRQA